MYKLLMVALGGAVGAVSRYALSGWVQTLSRSLFPWGTLSVNLVGSLIIGLVTGAVESVTVSPGIRLLVLTGGLGAFTTFSTFSLESWQLLRDRQYVAAGANLLGSLAAGLILVIAGMALGRWITSGR